MRIAAVDDEVHVLERFERMGSALKEFDICGLFETGDQLLDFLQENPLDAVFLDIEMPGSSGLQLSERIQNLDENIDIVFVTAFDKYAVEAFEVQALDYILKPLTQDRLAKTFNRLQRTRAPAQGQGSVTVSCIGNFEVFVNGEALTWKNSKAKEVFAFLIHKNGVPVSWEKIADAVWPDFNTEKAQTNFHATTYLLRKRLAGAGLSAILECVRGNYRVVTDKVSCDVYRLEELLRSNRLRREEDLRLAGEFLQKGYMEDCGYEWAYPKTAELDALCRSALKSQRKHHL